MKRHHTTDILLGLIAVLLLVTVMLQGVRLKQARDTADAENFAATEQARQLHEEIDRMFAETRSRRPSDRSARADDPWSHFERMHDAINQMFDEASRDFPGFPAAAFDADWENLAVSPAIDIRAEQDAYVIRVNLPGLDNQSVDVVAQDHVLVIAAETNTEDIRATDTGTRHHFSRRSFERSIRLPGDAKVDGQLKVTAKDGELIITVPREDAVPEGPVS